MDNKIIFGQADILFLYDEQWILVDYKTNAVSGEEEIISAQKHYTPQIHSYIQGLSAVMPFKIDRAFIHFLLPTRSLPVELPTKNN